MGLNGFSGSLEMLASVVLVTHQTVACWKKSYTTKITPEKITNIKVSPVSDQKF